MKKAILIAALSMSLSATAQAHVVFDEMEAEAANFFTAKLRVMHGCGDSPTSEITMTIPDGVTRVTPRMVPGWKVSVAMKKLDKPIMLHGFKVYETVGAVTWKGGSLPSFAFEQFETRMMMPDAPGKRVAFPVHQKCPDGDLHWDDIAKDGEDPWKLEEPAPFLTLKPAQ